MGHTRFGVAKANSTFKLYAHSYQPSHTKQSRDFKVEFRNAYINAIIEVLYEYDLFGLTVRHLGTALKVCTKSGMWRLLML